MNRGPIITLLAVVALAAVLLVVNMTVQSQLPGLAIPLTGGLVFSAVLGLWLTSSFTTIGVTT